MRSSKASAKVPPKSRTVGRPRRLSTEQVLQAGLDIGLERLTMSAVARHLGVRITVLYGYVSNRDELVRLASGWPFLPSISFKLPSSTQISSSDPTVTRR